ncbi:hypothetical protein JTB14_005202 [Gonioctena quinquepunctata]|nr:hypothetical protein JTB14_005202 [Gonioctena quinquepunctata]
MRPQTNVVIVTGHMDQITEFVQTFQILRRRGGKKEKNKQARPRPRIPPRVRGPNNPQSQENAPLAELLSALDELRDQILRRPILAGLIQR